MKKTIIFVAAALMMLPCARLSAQNYESDPKGAASYALPQTVLSVDAKVKETVFTAGPYAKYAKRMLGIAAREDDYAELSVESVEVKPVVEADQKARYFLPSAVLGDADDILVNTPQGLVALPGGSLPSCKGDAPACAPKAQQCCKEDYVTVPLTDSILMAGSLEEKAAEAALTILNLRRARLQIVTGDTDASYTGEAMQAALSEITRLEESYLHLFLGTTTETYADEHYQVIPSADRQSQTYVLFKSGDVPYTLVIKAEAVASANGEYGRLAAPKAEVNYRIPAMCSVEVTDGEQVLYSGRIPVYQLGVRNVYSIPAVSKK